MSERWKYQIKTGSFYGIFMTVAMTILQWQGRSIADELLSRKFFLNTLIYFMTGIFILGYFSWKAKLKKEGK
jgi:hypothetical protein